MCNFNPWYHKNIIELLTYAQCSIAENCRKLDLLMQIPIMLQERAHNKFIL